MTTFGAWLDTQSGAPGTLGQVAGVWKSSKGARDRVSSVDRVTSWLVSTMVEQGADQQTITTACYELAERWRASEGRSAPPAAPAPSEQQPPPAAQQQVPAATGSDQALLPALFARLGRMEGQLAEALGVLRPLGQLLAAADQATDEAVRSEAQQRAMAIAEEQGWLGENEPAEATTPPVPVTFYGAADQQQPPAVDGAARARWWSAVADAATTPPGGDAA